MKKLVAIAVLILLTLAEGAGAGNLIRLPFILNGAQPCTPPVPVAQTSVTSQDMSVGVNLANGATGGAATGATITTPPTNGTVTVSGTLATYTPTPGYSGGDTFGFELTNASGTSVAATATITVNQTYYVVSSAGSGTTCTLASPCTIAAAQTKMRANAGSGIMAAALRAGTYTVTSMLTLTSADNGETWQYFPGDGYDTAAIDGGGPTGTIGTNCLNSDPALLALNGASNVTINGLVFQNFGDYTKTNGCAGSGIIVGSSYGAQGGQTLYPQYKYGSTGPGWGFATDAAASNNVIENNIFRYLGQGGGDYSGSSYTWPAAIAVGFNAPGLHITHNYCYALGGGCVTLGQYGDGAPGGLSNVLVDYNAAINMFNAPSEWDLGVFYVYENRGDSTGIEFDHNFVRDAYPTKNIVSLPLGTTGTISCTNAWPYNGTVSSISPAMTLPAGTVFAVELQDGPIGTVTVTNSTTLALTHAFDANNCPSFVTPVTGKLVIPINKFQAYYNDTFSSNVAWTNNIATGNYFSAEFNSANDGAHDVGSVSWSSGGGGTLTFNPYPVATNWNYGGTTSVVFSGFSSTGTSLNGTHNGVTWNSNHSVGTITGVSNPGTVSCPSNGTHNVCGQVTSYSVGDTYKNNIFDMPVTDYAHPAFSLVISGVGPNNWFENNLLLTNATSSQMTNIWAFNCGSYFSGNSEIFSDTYGCSQLNQPIGITANLYWNYGVGNTTPPYTPIPARNCSGSDCGGWFNNYYGTPRAVAHDTNPVTTCGPTFDNSRPWTYFLTSGDCSFSSATLFPPQDPAWGGAGYWGPPGFVIPTTTDAAIGYVPTPPSYPH